ncbi:30S ribosomal protein S1 [Aerococcaceae bacterium DSM 111176]|nr:30S ribosomal protein S1 [Aerococcaceae bacterium DSM 111176]
MSEFVEENQNEVTMETMEDALGSVKEIKIGDTVIGDVLAFDDNQVRVSIQESGGLEGVVPRNELSATPVEDMTEIVNIGDEVELVVVKPIKDKENGNYLLSKKRVDAKKVWVELQEKFDNNETIEAPVKNKVKGGLVVDAGVRGFVPASMIEDFFVEDFTPYVGETLEFKIIEIDPIENRLILSHKEIAREEREAKRAEAMENLEEGAIVEGTVARLVNFGAFIDLGGVDGLVHISRIAHEHVEKPSDFLTPGETVTVKVLSVDPEAGRVSLSIKDTLEGPWENIETKAPQGAELTGTVKRLVNFGAFVEVFPGVEGLVHISQIAHEHIATPQDKLEEGQEVQVKVLSVDSEGNRLSLSIKALEEAPARAESQEGEEERSNNRPRRQRSNRRDNNNAPRNNNQARSNDDDVDTSFTFADMLGSQLADLDLPEDN